MRRIWKIGLVVTCIIAACGDAAAVETTTPPSESAPTTVDTIVTTTAPTATTALPPATAAPTTAAPTTTSPYPPGSVALSDADSENVAEYSTIAADYGSFGPNQPLGTDDGDGSGCAPGSDVLPDGIWYGRVVTIDDQTIEFDLMCRYSDDARQAIYTPDEVDFDTSSTNQSARLRSLPIGENAYWFIPTYGELTRLMIPALSDVTNLLDAARPGWLLVDQGAMMEFFAEPNID